MCTSAAIGKTKVKIFLGICRRILITEIGPKSSDFRPILLLFLFGRLLVFSNVSLGQELFLVFLSHDLRDWKQRKFVGHFGRLHIPNL